MVLGRYRSAPHSEVCRVLEQLSGEAEFVGLIPDISRLVIVEDPENVLTEGERNLITTGREDLQIKATFNLMPDPLRFMLRKGYPISFYGPKLREYVEQQELWVNKARELLSWNSGREFSRSEAFEHFITIGGSLFYHIRYIIMHPDEFEKSTAEIEVPRGEELYNALYSSKIAQKEVFAA